LSPTERTAFLTAPWRVGGLSAGTPREILAAAQDAPIAHQSGLATREALEEVAARVIGYRPGWVSLLLRLRRVLLALLGVQSSLRGRRPAPGPLPTQIGGQTGIFTVQSASPGRYWLGLAQDQHLDSWLGFHVEEGDGLKPRLVLATTVVRFHGWRGRLYWLAICPFHHSILAKALKPR
jgi:hypothetical protein